MLKSLGLLEWQNFLLLDLVDVGVLVVEGGTVVFANTTFSRVVGRNLRELQASSLRELAGDAWVDFTLGQSWADALPWPMADGTDRWFEVSMQPAAFEGREVNLATCIDVSARMRAEGAEANTLQMITEIIESNPVGTFVIDAEHYVTHWNRACELLTGTSAIDMVGSNEPWRAFSGVEEPLLVDLVMGELDQGALLAHYEGSFWPMEGLAGAFEAECFFPHMGVGGRWLRFAATPLRNAGGEVVGAIQTLIDITDRKRAEEGLRTAHVVAEQLVDTRTHELREAKAALEEDVARRENIEQQMHERLREITELNIRLHEAHGQLIQSEKLASIGQLAAGVAHEINNPIGYVFSNFGSLETYLADLLRLIDAYELSEPQLGDAAERERLASLRRELDLDYLKQDVLDLMRESREGIERVRKIVQDLKDFSHVDASNDWQWADLQRGLDSTLNVVNNEIKYKADVVREYGELPQVQCLPSQLNQVFMNLLVNAAHAIKGDVRGTITVSTGSAGKEVWVAVRDTGCGIPPELLQRIFDPFFTTKPVGKGTGLGLSLSYGIVQKHHGRIEVESTPDVGTTFRVILPVNQPDGVAETTPGGSA